MDFLIFTSFCSSNGHITQSHKPDYDASRCQNKTSLRPWEQLIKFPFCNRKIILLREIHIHGNDQRKITVLQFIILCHILIIVIFNSTDIRLKTEGLVIIAQISAIIDCFLISILLFFYITHIGHIGTVFQISQPVIHICIILIIFIVVDFII